MNKIFLITPHKNKIHLKLPLSQQYLKSLLMKKGMSRGTML